MQTDSRREAATGCRLDITCTNQKINNFCLGGIGLDVDLSPYTLFPAFEAKLFEVGHLSEFRKKSTCDQKILLVRIISKG